MPMELPPIEGYTGAEYPVVTVQMVVTELGDVIMKNAPHFATDKREPLIGRWITIETAKAMAFVEWDTESEDNTAIEKMLLEEAVLYRVCARCLRHAQVNRRADVQGFAPSYVYAIEEYEKESNHLLAEVLRKRIKFTISMTEIKEMYPRETSSNIVRMEGSCYAPEEGKRD